MQRKTIVALVAILAIIAALAFSPLQSILAGQMAVAPQATVDPAPTEPAAPVATNTPVATPEPEATATPQPTPTPAVAQSALAGRTWLTIYGRAFEAGPILGRLANYTNLDDMAAEVNPWIAEIKQVNGGKEVVPVIHLIYAMAIPCEPGNDNDCLFYLDSAGFPIVEEYIEPALERGWQVILDTQLSASSPVKQVQRMIDKGYLDYPNVHVAIDPEFHLHPGEDLPGIPIGQIDASDVNAVQKMLDDLVTQKSLPNKKVLIVHQFGDPMVDDGNPFMITNKTEVTTFENVDLVIDADGFGKPGIKTKKYNLMTDHEAYPFIQFRGIKLFFFNPHEERHHGDNPVMTWSEVFGKEEVVEGVRMKYEPDVIIVA